LGYDLDFRATVHLPSVFTAIDAMSGATMGCYPQGTREYQTLDSTPSFGARIGLKVLGQVPPKRIETVCSRFCVAGLSYSIS